MTDLDGHVLSRPGLRSSPSSNVNPSELPSPATLPAAVVTFESPEKLETAIDSLAMGLFRLNIALSKSNTRGFKDDLMDRTDVDDRAFRVEQFLDELREAHEHFLKAITGAGVLIQPGTLEDISES